MIEGRNQYGTPAYGYTDVDGDTLAVFPAHLPDGRRGVNIFTTRSGCTIVAEDIEDFIASVRAMITRAQGDHA